MINKLLIGTAGVFLISLAHAGETISVDDDSFGVIYESPMNTDKGLIMYISNTKCIGSYRIANHDLVIANGEINSRGPVKMIHLGNAKFRIDCGPQQSLTLIRE